MSLPTLFPLCYFCCWSDNNYRILIPFKWPNEIEAVKPTENVRMSSAKQPASTFRPHSSYSCHRRCCHPSVSTDARICYALFLASCRISLSLRSPQRWWKNIALLSNYYLVGYHVAICLARNILVLEQKLHVKHNTRHSCGQLKSRNDKSCNRIIPLKRF